MTDLILLHGALGSKDQLMPLASILSDTYSVHTLNFHGHGDREADSEFSIDSFAKNLEEFIQAQNLEKPSVFGYSMGGYVALRLQQLKPNLLNKIYTLGSMFEWSAEIAQHEIRMLNPRVIEEKVPKFAEALNKRHNAHGWKNVLHDTAQMMLALGDGAAVKWDASIQGDKVLIAVGSEDEMVSQQQSAQTAKIIGAEFKVFNGMKHPIEKVDLEVLATSIINFVGV